MFSPLPRFALLSFFGALSLSLAGPACGPMPEGEQNPYDMSLNAPGESSEAIINGQACGPETMDTAVAILIDADISMFGRTQTIRQPLCTGTLIAPDVVIAAAHCFDSDALTMGYGTVDREKYGISFTADLSAAAEDPEGDAPWPDDAIAGVEWYGHEDFSMDAFQNVAGPGDYSDIGIMFLSEAVTGIEPEVVITADEVNQLTQGAPVEIAGWGQQTVTSGYETPPPGTVGIKQCGDSTINELGNWEMQIGGDSSTTRKCHGDSGGPTYLTVESTHARKRRVIGITSHAYDETDCAKGGVDTRVDVWLSWLDTQMKEACQNGTRVWCEVEGIIPASYYDPAPVTTDNSDDKPVDQPGGCGGCTSTSSSHAGQLTLATLFGLLLRRRRRQG